MMIRVGLSVGILVSAFCAMPLSAFAQPDAGQTLQNLRDELPAPTRPDLELKIEKGEPAPDGKASEGPKVPIQSVQFEGNSLFTDEALLAVLENPHPQELNLAGMKALADQITLFYHAKNYPFAKAYIPTQTLENGVLTIEVIEGRYGRIDVVGGDSRAKGAQKFLERLNSGEVIQGRELERVSLTLDDQPGYRFIPVIRPGQNVGEGDLAFRMEREKPFTGGISVDHNGNRYTGRIRAKAEFQANSPFMFGDQLSVNAIYTEENMWFGSAGYSLPIAGTNLRGHMGYAHTYYQLGKEFKSLDVNGTAKIIQAGLSYPLIRTQRANLTLSSNFQHKWLTDRQDTTDTVNRKFSDSVQLALNFDRRDEFLGNGITYGTLAWTQGALNLDGALRAVDRQTAKTDGHFGKINLDVVRMQSLPIEHLVLVGRVSGQLAMNNLDSSEDFGLGGATGVRAYPVGEAYGDEGFFSQVELRYNRFKLASPYVFYDQGYSRTNHNPWMRGDNDRRIGGVGMGVRFNFKGCHADVLAAWRTLGGPPQSDTKKQIPMLWFNVGYYI